MQGSPQNVLVVRWVRIVRQYLALPCAYLFRKDPNSREGIQVSRTQQCANEIRSMTSEEGNFVAFIARFIVLGPNSAYAGLLFTKGTFLKGSMRKT